MDKNFVNNNPNIAVVSEQKPNIDESNDEMEHLSKHFDSFQTLLEAIPAPLFFKDENGFYIACNNTFIDFLGLEKEQIIGHNVDHVLENKTKSIRHNGTCGNTYTPEEQQSPDLKAIISEGAPINAFVHQEKLLKEDGSYGGIVAAIVNAAGRDETTQVLHENEVRFRELVSMLPQAVFETDTSGRILFHNKAFAEAFDLPPPKLSKASIFLIFLRSETENGQKPTFIGGCTVPMSALNTGGANRTDRTFPRWFTPILSVEKKEKPPDCEAS